jgi:hypothetical protein
MTIQIGPAWPGLVIMGWVMNVFHPGWNAPPELMSEPVEWTHFNGKPLPKGYPASMPPMTSLPPAWHGGIFA